MAADEKLSAACCANCGNTRIVYKTKDAGEAEKVHLCIPFAIPADTSLDDENVKKLGLMFSMEVVGALLAERKRRGQTESRLIVM
jgi:hypothetical protein